MVTPFKKNIKTLILLVTLLVNIGMPYWGMSCHLNTNKRISSLLFSYRIREKTCVQHCYASRAPFFLHANVKENTLSPAVLSIQTCKTHSYIRADITNIHNVSLYVTSKLDIPSKKLNTSNLFTGLNRTFLIGSGFSYDRKSSADDKGYHRCYTIYALLLGSTLGTMLLFPQKQCTVHAMGYDYGYFSIDTFEETIDMLEKSCHDGLNDKELEILYEATTLLLFQIQEKILQCKVISLVTGYPLYMKDWEKYKQIRNRSEALVQHLCKRNTSLATIGSMQELEDAFFAPKVHDDSIQDCFLGFFEGVGRGIIDTPRNLVRGIRYFFSFTSWVVCEMADQLQGHSRTYAEIDSYVDKVKTFEEAYTKSDPSIDGMEVISQVVELTIKAYDLIFYINTCKTPMKKSEEWIEQIEEVSKPLHDEFCLGYKRKEFFERYAEQFVDMSPSQRTKLVSYMLTSIVAEALFIEFLFDISGLGNLDKLGQNSKIGRWISKTSGGRATLKRLKKAHQRLRGHHTKLLKGGQTAHNVRNKHLGITMEQVEYENMTDAIHKISKADSYTSEVLESFGLFRGRNVKKIEKILDMCLLKNNWKKINKVLGGKGVRYIHNSKKNMSIIIHYGRKPAKNMYGQAYVAFFRGKKMYAYIFLKNKT